MRVNPLSPLIDVNPRLKLTVVRLPSVLTAEFGLVLKRFRNYVGLVAPVKRTDKDGVVPRRETRVLPRAERFAIETTIRFRNVGQNRWYQGKTENISGSGVLFRAKNLVPLKTRVEMIFSLPTSGCGACGADVRCFGQIARKAPPVGAGGETGLAATIEEYQLMHAEEGSHT